MLKFNANIVFQEDICVMISTLSKANNKKVPELNFRYWLSASFLNQGQGNIFTRQFDSTSDLSLASFMPRGQGKFDLQPKSSESTQELKLVG